MNASRVENSRPRYGNGARRGPPRAAPPDGTVGRGRTALPAAGPRNGSRERALVLSRRCSGLAPRTGAGVGRDGLVPQLLLAQGLQPLETLRNEGQAGVDLAQRGAPGVEVT